MRLILAHETEDRNRSPVIASVSQKIKCSRDNRKGGLDPTYTVGVSSPPDIGVFKDRSSVSAA